MAQVVCDIGKADEIHSGKARLGNPNPVTSHLLTDHILNLSSSLACKMRSIFDLSFSFGDPEINGFVRSSSKHNGVKACHLQLRAEKACCLRFSCCPCKGRFPYGSESTGCCDR